jgi:hypothetical protein
LFLYQYFPYTILSPLFSTILFHPGEISWFNSQGLTSDNLVKCVDSSGDVIAVPTTNTNTGREFLRYVWALVIFTPNTLTPQRLQALYLKFQKAYNSGIWANKTLDPVCDLSPTPFLSYPDGIGKWVCPQDLQRLLKKFYPTFAPGTGWGSHVDHHAILSGFWPKGTWTLANSSAFGVPASWMSPEARREYSKHNSSKKNRK